MIAGPRNKALVSQRRQCGFHGIGADHTEAQRDSVDRVIVRMIAQATEHPTKEVGTRHRHEC